LITNKKADKWILVYEGNRVTTIVEPGQHLSTISETLEFDSKEELQEYIKQNNMEVRDDFTN
jgi:hypothetical protein